MRHAQNDGTTVSLMVVYASCAFLSSHIRHYVSLEDLSEARPGHVMP